MEVLLVWRTRADRKGPNDGARDHREGTVGNRNRNQINERKAPMKKRLIYLCSIIGVAVGVLTSVFVGVGD